MIKCRKDKKRFIPQWLLTFIRSLRGRCPNCGGKLKRHGYTMSVCQQCGGKYVDIGF